MLLTLIPRASTLDEPPQLVIGPAEAETVGAKPVVDAYAIALRKRGRIQD
jgi:hypothetical protein